MALDPMSAGLQTQVLLTTVPPLQRFSFLMVGYQAALPHTG